jgi:hypothetical protein
MDLLETLGLGAKAPEDNVVFYAIYSDALTDGAARLAPAAARWAQCIPLALLATTARRPQQQALAAARAWQVASISSCSPPRSARRQSRDPTLPLRPSRRPAGCDRSELDALKARCMQLLMPHLEGYIWQRDRFDLRPSTEETPPWCLPRKGRTKCEQQQPGAAHCHVLPRARWARRCR